MKCDAYRVAELARVARGTVVGDPDTMVDGFAGLSDAAPGDIVYAEKDRAVEAALAGPAACIILTSVPPDSSRTFIRAAGPRLAFARILHHMAPPRLPPRGIHPSAVVASSAKVGEGVSIGPLCVVDDGAVIGDGSVLTAGCYVGRDATLGVACILWPHAVLYPGVHLGDRVIVHAGTVVGSDGFGYVHDETGAYAKIPQLGTVVIEDDVEIGANTAVDRAALGRTVIGTGSKIDNLVQVGHNVAIGAHTAVSGQAGIAGSSSIGARCILAGQVGIADHVTVEDGVIIGAQSGVPTGKRIGKGQVVWGTPARPVDEAKRMIAALSMLAKGRRRGPKHGPDPAR
ncbi:MAG: UDP-3-O-(3-hydroxymyristoyl)glucosamine N-acyltransferase [Candidatus Eisenbacteria bacterium]|jgi:UDP-3-O-[3-hydroxymyristoyl] glucosamine N-acyltransferase|nr:UDP-3-O-(3-hydroxymyristoyl)glucosamine N-acyltransferase [Candidatus Eisenbacteria bacterium]